MNKFKYYFILSITTLSLFSCSKNNDTPDITPPREYAVQYATDITDIEEYLNNYYITVTNNPGATDDQDVIFTKIPAGGTQASIMSYKDKTTFPKLLSREVKLHDITYKLYYLVLREGVGEKPSNVDGVFATYKGVLLDGTVFDQSFNTQGLYNLDGFTKNQGIPVIKGWSEVFPEFRTGTYSSNLDGTITHENFGAGVMFLPSALAYYQAGSNVIPAYAPVIFSFKLFELKRYDHDGDGIASYLEDIDLDGYINDYRNTSYYPTTPSVNPDDTDGDGIPNFLDVDDDGDGYGTKIEITNNGVVYPFAGIPNCDGNTTDPSRIKKHLDKNCH